MRIRLIATIAFFSFIYIFLYSIIPESLRIIYKLFPMVLIILLAMSIDSKNVRYQKNIILALTFCTIGDGALQFSIISLTSFLIGYLLFIRAFVTVQYKETPLYIKWMLLVFGGATIYWIGSSINYSSVLTMMICVYTILILSMGWASFKTGSHLAIAGSLLIIMSTLIATINKFIAPVNYSHQLITITYYTAQLLLALSIANHSETKSKDGTMKQT